MKHLFSALIAIFLFVGCHYDDSGIWNELNKQRFETLCNQMNTNSQALQTIINVSQNNDTVTSVSPITLNGDNVGYTITFKENGSITIYHSNSIAEVNSPIISAKLDTDGVYYWTLDGDWLVDSSSNKIAVIKEDRQNNIIPYLKIEDNYWHITYDNGATWTKLDHEIDNNNKEEDNKNKKRTASPCVFMYLFCTDRVLAKKQEYKVKDPADRCACKNPNKTYNEHNCIACACALNDTVDSPYNVKNRKCKDDLSNKRKLVKFLNKFHNNLLYV